jgi:hypothetical protein
MLIVRGVRHRAPRLDKTLIKIGPKKTAPDYLTRRHLLSNVIVLTARSYP